MEYNSLDFSEHSLSSDWVEHEVRTARELEKKMARDVLCPVALDDSWKSSPCPERIMEYNILDFSDVIMVTTTQLHHHP